MNADPRIKARAMAQRPTAPRREEPKAATVSPLEILLSIEGEARSVPTLPALQYFICNETRKLVAAEQFLFFSPGARKGKWRVSAASSVSTIDRNAPLVRQAEAIISDIDLDTAPVAIDGASLGFNQALAVPLTTPSGLAVGRLVLLRAAPFLEGETVLLQRLGGTYGHALSYFDKSKRKAKSARRFKLGVAIGALVTAIALFIPVPMSVLAPAEIVARAPQIVTAPMDGVIQSIDVEPNAPVAAGTILMRFNDVALRGQLEVASRTLEVAAARHRRVLQGASLSADMRREMAVAKSELGVATAERDEAAAALERTQVVSPRDGIVLLTSKDDWVGKPVSTGERVMEIGDPDEVEVRIDVGVGDSVVLNPEASVRVFLHNDPLAPFDADFESAGFRAQETDQNTLGYRVTAVPIVDQDKAKALRIGLRGTARITHGSVTLGYYLFRRPISVARQWLGL